MVISMAETQDKDVLKNIEKLVKEEQELFHRNDLTDPDRVRLQEVEVQLDQCWDLLRQRRALREFGEDPAQAKVRPAKVVEKYEN
jgi:uncharacterized protein DUF2630